MCVSVFGVAAHIGLMAFYLLITEHCLFNLSSSIYFVNRVLLVSIAVGWGTLL